MVGTRDRLRVHRDDRPDRVRSAAGIFSIGSLAMAVAAAENLRALRAKGFTVRKTIDCWTLCIREGLALLHQDRDFDALENELGPRIVHL